MGSVIGIIVCLLTYLVLILIFGGLGFYTLKKKTPMHFWAGTTVKNEENINISEYNKKNAVMWFLCAGLSLIDGIICIFMN